MARHSFPGRCLKAALDVTSLAGGDRLRLCQFRRRRSVRTSGATATQNWRPRAGLSTRPAVSRRALLAPTHAGRDCTAPASDLSLQCTAAAMAGEHAPLSAGFEPHPPALVPPRLPLERPIHLLGPAPPRPAPPRPSHPRRLTESACACAGQHALEARALLWRGALPLRVVRLRHPVLHRPRRGLPPRPAATLRACSALRRPRRGRRARGEQGIGCGSAEVSSFMDALLLSIDAQTTIGCRPPALLVDRSIDRCIE
jgi:hypothetical protein